MAQSDHPAVKLWRMAVFLDGEQGMDRYQWFGRLTNSDPGRRYFGRTCSQLPEYHDKLWSECSPDLKRFHAGQEFMHDTGMGLEEAARPTVAPSAVAEPVAWRPMSEEPTDRQITARLKLEDGSWWYARVKPWSYPSGDGGRFGDHGYTLYHYNGNVSMGRFYGPFDSWCEIDTDLGAAPPPPSGAVAAARTKAAQALDAALTSLHRAETTGPAMDVQIDAALDKWFTRQDWRQVYENGPPVREYMRRALIAAQDAARLAHQDRAASAEEADNVSR